MAVTRAGGEAFRCDIVTICLKPICSNLTSYHPLMSPTPSNGAVTNFISMTNRRRRCRRRKLPSCLFSQKTSTSIVDIVWRFARKKISNKKDSDFLNPIFRHKRSKKLFEPSARKILFEWEDQSGEMLLLVAVVVHGLTLHKRGMAGRALTYELLIGTRLYNECTNFVSLSFVSPKRLSNSLFLCL